MTAINDVDAALAEMMSLAGRDSSKGESRSKKAGNDAPKKNRSLWGLCFRWLISPVILLTLPFLALLRGSTLLYQHSSMPIWLCVVSAAAISGFFVVFASWRLASRFGLSIGKYTRRVSFALAASFVLFTTLYISADNVKTPEVAETYTALHPLLRMATSTMIIIDSEGVITDGARVVEDYEQMGLATNTTSLHYEQADGYVHALDLRTKDRSDLRNMLSALYFRALGFDTLRHVGTADHLHISLKMRSL